MDTDIQRAICRAVYEEHMRAYHEYIEMPNYVLRFWKQRKKDRLGYYLDGLSEWGKRLDAEYWKVNRP